LRQGANVELDKVAGFVQVFSPNKIIIEGHTDSDGGLASNQRLSEERAKAMRIYLVDSFEWITPRMIEAIGYGEERPRTENDTDDNKQMNRRIEFTVID
jgi:OmpA-OmpF porin, OOP family